MYCVFKYFRVVMLIFTWFRQFSERQDFDSFSFSVVLDLLPKHDLQKRQAFLLFGRTRCVKTTGNTSKSKKSILQNIVFFNSWEARGVTKPRKSLSFEKVQFSKHIVFLSFGPPQGAQTYGNSNSLKTANQ